jgi:hypothetical protein
MSERPSQNFVFQGYCAIAVNKETKMLKISKQEYTAEFKKQAVKRVTVVCHLSMR